MTKATKPRKLLLLEDDQRHAELIAKILTRKGFAVEYFRRGTEALDAYRSRPGEWAAAVIDYMLRAHADHDADEYAEETTGMGVRVLADLREAGLSEPAIILTMNTGAAEAELESPRWKRIRDTKVIGKHDYGTQRLAIELIRELDPKTWERRKELTAHLLLDELPELNEVLREVRELSYQDVPFLVYGETGVGKEAIARYSCLHSGRRGQFLAIGAGDLVGEAVMVTLCGRTKDFPQVGAPAQPGAFEKVGHGVVYLGDIDKYTSSTDRPLNPLVHVMDEHHVTPMGATEPVPVHCVVIGSANRLELLSEPILRRFRRRIRVPPLRERPNDLPILARFIWRRTHEDQHLDEPVEVSVEHVRALLAHPLPGNIRDLETWAITGEIPQLSSCSEEGSGPAHVPAGLRIPVRLDDEGQALYRHYFGHRGRAQFSYFSWLVNDLGLPFLQIQRATGLKSKELLSWLYKFGLVARDMPEIDVEPE